MKQFINEKIKLLAIIQSVALLYICIRFAMATISLSNSIISYYDSRPVLMVGGSTFLFAVSLIMSIINFLTLRNNRALRIIFPIFIIVFTLPSAFFFAFMIKYGQLSAMLGLIIVAIVIVLISIFEILSCNSQSAASSPAPRTSVTPPTNNIEKLKEYKQLLDNGVITQAEYDEMKKSILTSAQR